MAYLPPMNGGRLNANIGGNTAGVSSSLSYGTMVLAGGNNITLSQNGSTISFNAANAAAATNAIGATGGNVSGNVGVISSTNFSYVFAGGNNMTLSQSISNNSATLSISGPSFANANNVSLGISNNGVVTASATFSQSQQTANLIQGISASGSSVNSGNITFANANSITFGMNNGVITASASPDGIQNVVAGASTINSGTLSFVNSNNVSFGLNNGSLSASVAGGASVARWEFPANAFNSLSTYGVSQSALSIQHMYMPFYVSGTAMKIGGMLAPNTSNAAATGSASFNLWMGIYSMIQSNSSMSLISAGVTNNSFTWQGASSASSNFSSYVGGMRQMTVPMNINMTPGDYWVAAAINSSSAGLSAGYSLYGNNQIVTAGGASAPVLMPIGSAIGSARDVYMYQGIYTANTTAGPTLINGSQINNTSAGNVMRAAFYNVIYSATY